MTCADVVGFHAFDHARHFLNATKRMLGIRSHTTQGGEQLTVSMTSHTNLFSSLVTSCRLLVLYGPSAMDIHNAQTIGLCQILSTRCAHLPCGAIPFPHPTPPFPPSQA